MADLISKIREEQAALAAELSTQLYEELRPDIDGGKHSVLKGYVRDTLEGESPEDIPPEAMQNNPAIFEFLKGMIKVELGSMVTASIIGYTDWILCRMVRSKDYSIPTLGEINFAAIGEKYATPSLALRWTVNCLHLRENLPILGKLENETFCPDQNQLEEWKTFYDWKQE